VVNIRLAGKLLLNKIKVIQQYLNNLQCQLLLLSIFFNKILQIYKGKSILYNQYKELGILIKANKIELITASKSKEDNIKILKGVNKFKSSSSIKDLLVGS
jgi:hypothetical protein